MQNQCNYSKQIKMIEGNMKSWHLSERLTQSYCIYPEINSCLKAIQEIMLSKTSFIERSKEGVNKKTLYTRKINNYY